MKLRRLEIENLRGFAKPLAIEVDDFTGLIGRNDIGKSTILAAITIFHEGEGVKIDQGDGSVNGEPNKVRITCEYENLPEKVILDDSFETSLKDERVLTETGRLRITKIYDCTKTKIVPTITIEADQHPVDTNGNSLLTLTLPELKKLAGELGVELEKGEASVKARIRKAIVERSDKFTCQDTGISVSKNDSSTLWNQLLRHLPMCALFISDRSSSDKDKEAQTPMGIAVETALSAVQEDLDKLTAHVEAHVQNVANRTLAKLQEMNPGLASELSASLRDKPKWKDLFKYSLSSNDNIPMDKRGSGVRRLVLLNFFRAEAERKSIEEGCRPVKWLNGKQPISRDLAKSGLRSRMKTQQTTAAAIDLVTEIAEVLSLGANGKNRNEQEELKQLFGAGLRRTLGDAALREILSGHMDERGFEHLIEKVLLGMGAVECAIIPRRKDQGVDIRAAFAIGPTEIVIGVQAKYHRSKTEAHWLDHFVDGLKQEGIAIGWFITSGEFADDFEDHAQRLSEKHGKQIHAISGAEFAALVVDYAGKVT